MPNLSLWYFKRTKPQHACSKALQQRVNDLGRPKIFPQFCDCVVDTTQNCWARTDILTPVFVDICRKSREMYISGKLTTVVGALLYKPEVRPPLFTNPGSVTSDEDDERNEHKDQRLHARIRDNQTLLLFQEAPIDRSCLISKPIQSSHR